MFELFELIGFLFVQSVAICGFGMMLETVTSYNERHRRDASQRMSIIELAPHGLFVMIGVPLFAITILGSIFFMRRLGVAQWNLLGELIVVALTGTAWIGLILWGYHISRSRRIERTLGQSPW